MVFLEWPNLGRRRLLLLLALNLQLRCWDGFFGFRCFLVLMLKLQLQLLLPQALVLLAGLVQLRIDDVAGAAEGEALEHHTAADLESDQVALLEEGHVVDGATILLRRQLAASLASRQLGSLHDLWLVAGRGQSGVGRRSLARLIRSRAWHAARHQLVVVALVRVAGMVLGSG